MENVYPQRKLSKGVSCNVMDLKPLKKHPCTFAAVCVFSVTQAFESIYHGGKKIFCNSMRALSLFKTILQHFSEIAAQL